MKYILGLNAHGQVTFELFSEEMTHSEVFRSALRRGDLVELQSAGFYDVHHNKVSGESESLQYGHNHQPADRCKNRGEVDEAYILLGSSINMLAPEQAVAMFRKWKEVASGL